MQRDILQLIDYRCQFDVQNYNLNDEQLQIQDDKLTEVQSISFIFRKSFDDAKELSQKISIILQQREKLTYFALRQQRGVALQLKDYEIIGTRLMRFDQLEQIILYFDQNKNNNLQEGLTFILNGISQLKNLKEFSLYVGSFNYINAIGCNLISETLSKLCNLKRLDLHIGTTSIKSQGLANLWKGLNSLYNLQRLSLSISSNSIGESGMENIEESFSHLQSLQQLLFHLGENNLRNSGVNCLGRALKKLVCIKEISLKILKNNISGCGFKEINLGLKEQACLEKLFLMYFDINTIKETHLQSLEETFQNKQCLLELSLFFYRTEIDGSGTFTIGQSLKNLSNLIKATLMLDYLVKVDEQGAKGIKEGLQGLQNLRELELEIQCGYLNQIAGQYIGDGMKNLKSLTKLTLNFRNQYKMINSFSFGGGIQFLSKLLYLNIVFDRNSDLGSEGMIYFARALENLINLKVLILDIQENNISSVGAIHLSNGLKSLSQLNELKLSIQKNHIQSVGLISLGEAIAFLKNLYILTICIRENNQIESYALQKFMEYIKEVTTLTNLKFFLKLNNIDSQGTLSISKSVKALFNLNVLSISIAYKHIKEQDVYQFFSDIKLSQNLSIIKFKNYFSKEISFPFISKCQDYIKRNFKRLVNLKSEIYK